MRVVLLILASMSLLSSKAQTHLPVGTMNYNLWQPFPGYNISGDSSHNNSKWYFSKYAAISAGYGFYNGGSASYISAPFVLQLNHPINNNLLAFAAVSAGPAFFSRSFTDPSFNKSYPGSYSPNAYSFGFNSRIEMGLMYVNDAKTFSISGSIGVERSSYPGYPSNPANPVKQPVTRRHN